MQNSTSCHLAISRDFWPANGYCASSRVANTQDKEADWRQERYENNTDEKCEIKGSSSLVYCILFTILGIVIVKCMS